MEEITQKHSLPQLTIWEMNVLNSLKQLKFCFKLKKKKKKILMTHMVSWENFVKNLQMN